MSLTIQKKFTDPNQGGMAIQQATQDARSAPGYVEGMVVVCTHTKPDGDGWITDVVFDVPAA